MFATATNADILQGKTAVVGKELITGTMKDNSGKLVTGTFDSGGSNYVRGKIPEDGHYDTSSILRVPVTNLVSGNIRSGVNIGGVVGTYSGTLFTGTVTVKIVRMRDTSTTITGYSNLQNKVGTEYVVSYSNSSDYNYLVRKRSVSGSSHGSLIDVGTYKSLDEILLTLYIEGGIITKPLYTQISIPGHTILWGSYSEDNMVFVK